MAPTTSITTYSLVYLLTYLLTGSVVMVVDDQCQLGCSGLTYCSSFNHRPTELFRSCTKRADDAAKSVLRLWQSGSIALPLLLPYDIPVKGTSHA